MRSRFLIDGRVLNTVSKYSQITALDILLSEGHTSVILAILRTRDDLSIECFTCKPRYNTNVFEDALSLFLKRGFDHTRDLSEGARWLEVCEEIQRYVKKHFGRQFEVQKCVPRDMLKAVERSQFGGNIRTVVRRNALVHGMVPTPGMVTTATGQRGVMNRRNRRTPTPGVVTPGAATPGVETVGASSWRARPWNANLVASENNKDKPWSANDGPWSPSSDGSASTSRPSEVDVDEREVEVDDANKPLLHPTSSSGGSKPVVKHDLTSYTLLQDQEDAETYESLHEHTVTSKSGKVNEPTPEELKVRLVKQQQLQLQAATKHRDEILRHRPQWFTELLYRKRCLLGLQGVFDPVTSWTWKSECLRQFAHRWAEANDEFVARLGEVLDSGVLEVNLYHAAKAALIWTPTGDNDNDKEKSGTGASLVAAAGEGDFTGPEGALNNMANLTDAERNLITLHRANPALVSLLEPAGESNGASSRSSENESDVNTFRFDISRLIAAWLSGATVRFGDNARLGNTVDQINHPLNPFALIVRHDEVIRGILDSVWVPYSYDVESKLIPCSFD